MIFMDLKNLKKVCDDAFREVLWKFLKINKNFMVYIEVVKDMYEDEKTSKDI